MFFARLPLFVGATLLICLLPGPNVLMTVSFSLKEGRAPALRAVLGTSVASIIYLTVSVLGLVAVLRASQPLFELVRYAGAGYLIYLGIRMLRNAWRPVDRISPLVELQSRPFVQGLATHLSNPKAVIYWTALLPQFLDPSRALTQQIIVLGCLAIVLDFAVLAGYAVLAAFARNWLVSSRWVHWIDRVAGGFFVVAGTLLAVASQVSG